MKTGIHYHGDENNFIIVETNRNMGEAQVLTNNL